MAEPVAVVSDVNGEASGSSDTAEKSTTEKVNDLATSLLAQGRRHLLVSDIPAAITALAESCRLLGELYGDFADECAESYYYYGMALLEMARTDSDVLGDAVDAGDKEEDSNDDENADEDDDEEEEDDEEAEGSEGSEGKKDNKADEVSPESDKTDSTKSEAKSVPSEEKPSSDAPVKAEESTSTSQPEAEKSEKIETEKPESKSTAEESSADVEMKESPAEEATKGETGKAEEEASKPKETAKPKSESKGKSLKPAAATSEAKAENGDDGEDITDDVSNLQLAWEMFELAKKIYQRKAESDPKVMPKLADALIRLAEVAIESENYTSAIEDLKKCLEIQHTAFPSDSRSLAETFYQLGVAYTFTTEFQEAIKNFDSAAKVIELRIDNLKNPKERNPSIEDPKPFFHTIEGEIEELEALLPDIKEKIADTIDLEKDAARKMAENGVNGSGPSSSKENGSVIEAEPSSTNGNSPASLKPATDISHLIRKKRKPEEQEAEGSVAKKVCPEPEAADAAAV